MPGSTPTVEIGDVPRADAETVRIVQDGERRVDRLPVHQRLAHAHEHDVRDVDRRIEQPHLAHLARRSRTPRDSG